MSSSLLEDADMEGRVVLVVQLTVRSGESRDRDLDALARVFRLPSLSSTTLLTWNPRRLLRTAVSNVFLSLLYQFFSLPPHLCSRRGRVTAFAHR